MPAGSVAEKPKRGATLPRSVATPADDDTPSRPATRRRAPASSKLDIWLSSSVYGVNTS
jgi:hypothetical protein